MGLSEKFTLFVAFLAFWGLISLLAGIGILELANVFFRISSS